MRGFVQLLPDNPVLNISHLKVFYYTVDGVVKAVDDVNLNIPKGKTAALVGESGCGKSTVSLAIMRLVPKPGRITSGKILLGGQKDLLQLREEEMRQIRGGLISMIFQNPMTFLNPVMKVGSQITEILTAHDKCDRRASKEKVLEMLNKIRIPHSEQIYESYPHQLSGGMAQRVIIATALLCNPLLLIADEPTTALDVTIQAQVLNEMKELRRDFNISLLLITHDLGIVADIADIVYVMYAGKNVESADVISLYEEPMHPYTAALLASVLSIDEFKKELVTIEGTVPDLMDRPSGCPFHPRCPKVREICTQKEPPAVQIDGTHTVSCWLFGGL